MGEPMFEEDEYDDENPLKGFWLEGDSLAPPCQCDMDVVEEILRMAQPTDTSVLCDLGCGDGRICLTASHNSGCRSFGCEIEPDLYKKFVSHIANLNLSHLVTAINDDLREIDFSSATIIVLYLLSESIELIKPKLEECLKNGSILICNTWGPKDFVPVLKKTCGKYNNVNLFKYDLTSIPANCS